jgi:hypothetical protein
MRRLAARSPRYVVLGAVAIMAALGLREIVAPGEAAPVVAQTMSSDPASESYALRLARAYLSYDAANPERRERELAQLLPDELAPNGGFVPRRGSRRVLWAQVAESAPVGRGERSIVVEAGTDAGVEPLHLALRVRRTRTGALQLSGYPALVGAAAVARGALPERAEVEDRGVVEVGRRVVANYLAGERANLRADLLPGAEVSLPELALHVREVLGVAWAGEEGHSPIAVTVEANGSDGLLYTLGYRLGIERRRGRPLVSFIETVPTDPTRRDR